MKISATIITLNEADNLENCLNSLEWCDEIVIVDSGSNDNTIEIAKRFGAKVFYNEFKGFGEQKQFAVSKAKNNWILSIDADEIITDELKNNILKLDKKGEVSGWNIPFRTNFLGKVLLHGTCGMEFHLRLFNKKHATFTDSKIHETVTSSERIANLKGFIIHQPYSNLNHYFLKFNEYTSMMAQHYYLQKKNLSVIKIFVKQPIAFFDVYIMRLGFLDGFAGFIWAFLHSFYSTIKYIKLYELYKG